MTHPIRRPDDGVDEIVRGKCLDHGLRVFVRHVASRTPVHVVTLGFPRDSSSPVGHLIYFPLHPLRSCIHLLLIVARHADGFPMIVYDHSIKKKKKRVTPKYQIDSFKALVMSYDPRSYVSILAGTLARLDRDAPHYKKDGYNDFNTFYMQAASGTKGGSSGSPVIDCQGRAVALNAGSKSSSASAFFLPLERVVRALNYLQKGKDASESKWDEVVIPRGTLQVTFLHKGYDETRRLGLRSETELMVRHASPAGETGMLVVDSVVPGGPGHKLVQPGDVLVLVNDEVITQFLKLETLLDDGVNQKIKLQIERGGASLSVELTVQDLHSITPNSFLEVSGAVIQSLSYQQVGPSDLQYMLTRAGVPRHAIIKKFAGEEISKLDDLIVVLSKLSRGARVPLEYVSYADRHRRKSVLVTVDRHEWYAPPQIYTRNDGTGLWTIRPALPPGSLLSSAKVQCVLNNTSSKSTISTATEVDHMELMLQQANKDGIDSSTRMRTNDEHVGEEYSMEDSNIETKKRRVDEDSGDGMDTSDNILHEPAEEKLEVLRTPETTLFVDDRGTAAAANASVAERVIEPTLVMFEVHVPPSCMLDGVHSQHFFGTGVVVYHSKNLGLAVVDKNTVAVSVSDVMLSFAAYPIEIPGEVVFLHPVHNYALVAYDPSALGPIGASAVRAAELLPEPGLRRGDSVYLVGLSRSLQATSRKSTVTNPCAALNIGSADCPRYRATNMEVIELDTDFGSTFSGVLTDDRGRVQAIWGSFSTQVKYGCSTSEDHQFVRGIPIYAISEVLDKIISGESGPLRLINGVKRPMPLVRILEAELYPTLLSKARSFGLSDAWVQALVKKDPTRRQVLRVKGCLAGSKAENLLEQGDMILAIKKEPVTCFHDIDKACQESENSNGELNMTIFRQGREMDIVVGTDVRHGNGTTGMVNWCGCVVQDPHPAVRALGFLPEEGHGVYVARWCHGSPAHRYGLYALQWIVEVNGKPTPDVESFLEVCKGLEHEEFVRLRTVHLNGKPRVLTLKQDLHYWPTWELKFDPESAMWRRRIIKSMAGSTQ
ncbi:prolyl aminopeptidase [Ranunculus cassubicifolius]